MPAIPGCPPALQQLVWDCTAANRRQRWALGWAVAGVRMPASGAAAFQAAGFGRQPRTLAWRCDRLACPACCYPAEAADTNLRARM